VTMVGILYNVSARRFVHVALLGCKTPVVKTLNALAILFYAGVSAKTHGFRCSKGCGLQIVGCRKMEEFIFLSALNQYDYCPRRCAYICRERLPRQRTYDEERFIRPRSFR
jgi:hypothetical protein